MLLKKIIFIAVMFAFVLTTMPMPLHAMTHSNGGQTAQVEQSTSDNSHGDCHHDNPELKAQKISTHDDAHSVSDKGCCDKTCKCMNGACHSAGAALGFHESYLVLPRVSKNLFLMIQEIASADFLNRIKRPPRT